MKPLTGEEILKSPRSKPEPVDVPEWGGRVWVRMLTAQELDNYQIALSEGKDRGSANIRGTLLALCCCDEQGHPLFTEAQADDLAQVDCGPAERIIEKAQALNGLSSKAREQARKN